MDQKPLSHPFVFHLLFTSCVTSATDHTCLSLRTLFLGPNLCAARAGTWGRIVAALEPKLCPFGCLHTGQRGEPGQPGMALAGKFPEAWAHGTSERAGEAGAGGVGGQEGVPCPTWGVPRARCQRLVLPQRNR